MELGCLGKDSRNIEKHTMFSLENEWMVVDSCR